MTSSILDKQLLSPNVRNALTQLSNRIFSPTEQSQYDNLKNSLPGNTVSTSLPLQMSMYFNAFFFPFWLLACSLMLEIKYTYLDPTYRVILIAILVIFSLVEGIRLFLGIVGNLQEKVPELFGFLLLTILPQVPFLLFLLLNEFTIILPLERAVHIVQALLLVVELIAGSIAAKAITRQQATKFHLQQFVDLEHLPSDNVQDVYVNPNATLFRRQNLRA
uniref:Transmembrane protein 17B-like n=1 Tax=Ciona intestinalis TaxID=7719 RepID=F7B9H1_CIOIN|nr:transmembrane protein 17B-like [Ciona intestinalis]|eukprot:XP_002129567.1 transmembrane protein 17B-like [Ciona intestinalis]